MRQVYKFGFLALMLHAGWVNGQDSTFIQRHRSKGSLIKLPVYKHRVGADFSIESGSSRIPSTVLNRFLLGGYIASEKIDNAEERLSGNIRAGAMNSMYFQLFNYPKSDTSWQKKYAVKFSGVTVGLIQIGGLRLNNHAFRLIFQGNGQYPGEQLNARIMHAKRMRWQEVNFWWNKQFTPKSTGFYLNSFAFSFGLAHLSAYQSLRNFEVSVFTDTLGQRLDVNWGGNLESVTRHRNTAGFGALLNGILNFRRESYRRYNQWRLKHKGLRDIDLGLYSFGIFKVNDYRNYFRNQNAVGQTVRIENENTTLADVFGGNYFATRRDSLMKNLDIDSQLNNKWVLSPFTMALSANIGDKGYSMGIIYINIPGYLPQFTLYSKTYRVFGPKVSRKFPLAVAPSLAIGGFDNWNLNLRMSYYKFIKSRNGMQVSAHIFGLESLAIPARQHGLGGRIRLIYSF